MHSFSNDVFFYKGALNIKWLGSGISIILIASLIMITIKTNIANNDKPEYASGMIEDLSDELAIAKADKNFGLALEEYAPDFELTTLAGETIKLSDYRGKKIVLNFWASWCPPCRFEMPHMENYYQQYKEQDNVEILAVNMATMERSGRDDMEGFIGEFVGRYHLSFPIPLDETGDIKNLYKVLYVPTTYFINEEGVIKNKVRSALDEVQFKEYVDNI